VQPTLADSRDCLLCERCTCARSRDAQGASKSHFWTGTLLSTFITL